MYATFQVKLDVPDHIKMYLEYQCIHANSLTNCALYLLRQQHFENCPKVEFFDSNDMYRSEFKTRLLSASYSQLCNELKDNIHYKILGGQCAQQTLKSVVESFSSYNELLRLFWAGEGNKPKIPNYRKKGGLAGICFPVQNLSFDVETGECRLSISRENSKDVKTEFELTELRVNGPTGIKVEQIVEVRIIPKHNEFYVEYAYRYGHDGATCNLFLSEKHALSIDPGLNNWLTCLSTQGKSFIIDGKKIKSINQNYNKRVAEIKKGKSNKYWDFELARLTDKRNRQVRDAVNKAARFVINYCLHHRIGYVVFGWNKGNKQEINLGDTNNQNFVQIPTARLKKRIHELCEANGIQFVETEESYTSQASFLDDDFLPTYGEKPKQWKPSGKRILRGLYLTAVGAKINADCNGAANILRKVATQLGINLAKVGRAALNLPKRYDLFSDLKKLYRRRLRCVSLDHVAT